MDTPNKRRRLAPKLPDPPPSAPAPLPSVSTSMTQPVPLPADLAHEPGHTHAQNSAVYDVLSSPSTVSPERHDFEAFAKHLQNAAMYIYHQGQKLPYTHVSALLLYWDDDGNATSEAMTLERVLRDRYNFQTEHWGIPATANPSANLGVRAATFLNQASADHLLIIYYTGHGYTGPDHKLYWSCNAQEDSPKIKWDGVRSLFDDAQSDILIILDSCIPKDTTVTGNHGVKQLIAACAPESGLRDPTGRSFTSYVVESLNNLCNGRPFNAQRLYDEILTSQQLYERKYLPRLSVNSRTNAPSTNARTPLFLTLTPDKSKSLDLSPIPRNLPPALQNVPSRDAPVISPAAVADMVFDEARVLVCTTFVGDSSPDLVYLNRWLGSLSSPLASKVAVEGIFLGPPTVLLISIPLPLWNIIQHDKICSFLSFINSRNLTQLYDGLIKAVASEPPQSSPASVPDSSTDSFRPPAVLPIPNPPLATFASAKDVEDGRTLLEARELAASLSISEFSARFRPELYHHQAQQSPLPPPSGSHQQHEQQQRQHQHQPALPPPSQLLQTLPPTNLHRPNSHPLPTSLHRAKDSSKQYELDVLRRHDSLPQLQHHHQRQPPLTVLPHLPPLTSLTHILPPANTLADKDESEESAEMKEAAEQLEALSHNRTSNGRVSPVFPASSSQLSKIAQDAIRQHTDDSMSDDTSETKTDSKAPVLKKTHKTKKEYRFKNPQSQGELPPHSPQPRPASDSQNQSLSTLLPQALKQDIQCHWCSHEPFKDSSSLRKHIASAHTRPFPCAFAFAGCTSTFGSKNEWKRHIASQHLCLQYYRCSSCSQTSADGKGNEFNRKDLFTQHLRRMHAPMYIRKAIQKRDSKIETDWEDYVKDMQKTCCIVRRHPPQHSACPKSGCGRVFDGRGAWDEWTEHVGRHMENGEGDLLGIDSLLVSWALDEGIIAQLEDGTYRLSNPMGNNGGSGSSHGGGNNGVGSNDANNEASNDTGNDTGNEAGNEAANEAANDAGSDTGNKASNGDARSDCSNARGDDAIESIAHHGRPSPDGKDKRRSLPTLSVVAAVADTARAHDAQASSEGSLVTPPTPPPTTTRQQNEEGSSDDTRHVPVLSPGTDRDLSTQLNGREARKEPVVDQVFVVGCGAKSNILRRTMDVDNDERREEEDLSHGTQLGSCKEGDKDSISDGFRAADVLTGKAVRQISDAGLATSTTTSMPALALEAAVMESGETVHSRDGNGMELDK